MATTYKGTKAGDTQSGAFNTFYGNGGNDTLTTTLGTGSRMYGGIGDDIINGAAGNDSLFGGDGIDKITTGAGNDKAYGGNGNDSITGGAGNDYMSGDAGNDTLTGGAGNQTLAGGAGNDSLDAGTDATVTDKHGMFGGTGNDSITVLTSAGLNTIYGGAGNDTLTGSSAGKDTLNGGTDTNTITGNATNHANETVTYWNVGHTVGSSVGVTANLATGASTAAWTTNGVAFALSDTITNVDHLTGSSWNDTLTGSTVANKILGGLGNDTIDSGGTSTSGAAGTANTGNDTLVGGYGNDMFVMHSGTATAESIDGGLGVDTVDFSNVFANASIATVAGANNIYAASTATGIVLNLSSDISTGVNLQGAAGIGHVTAVEKVIGTSGADYIVAVGGATIDAGAGNDTILSAQQASAVDILKGGAGTNVYDATAASGKDYFGVGNATGELDNIFAYNGVQDKFYVSLANYTTAGHTMLAASYTGAGTVASPYVLNAGDMIINNSAVAITNVGTVAGHSQFVYNSSTGNLFFDADGSGLGNNVQVAHLDVNTFTTAHTAVGAAVLDNTDFILVA